MDPLSRRQLLRAGLGLGTLGLAALGGVGTLGLGAAGCAGPVRTAPSRAYLQLPPAAEPGRVALGWYEQLDARAACQKCLRALGDLPWLRHGDSVLVKVSSNSPNEHPAVTSPEAVEAMVGLLRARGAGRVVVADQAGVEHVRRTAEGRTGSTREVMTDNGLAAAAEQAGAELCCFDDGAWDDFFQPRDELPHHWEQTLRLPKILEQIDHVIYLPRLGTHGVAGVSAGAKIAVGFVRDDSRQHLHGRADRFFEQIAELSLFSPLRDKLRLVLTLARSALLKIGPDFGSHYDLGGVLAFGSTRLFDHDALATSLLAWLGREDRSFFDLYTPYPKDADFWNRHLFAEIWGGAALADYRPLHPYPIGRSLAADRCLSHLAVLEGRRPGRIELVRDGDAIPEELLAHLRAHPDGIFALD